MSRVRSGAFSEQVPGLQSGDLLGIVEEASPYTGYLAEFTQAIEGMEAYLQQGRGLKESLLIAFGLINGGVASYQSFAFGSKFTRRVLGESEANAPSWLADSLAPLSGLAAFAANAMIPVISSDIATIASMKMFACVMMGIMNVLTCFQVAKLKRVARQQEWYSKSAFVYSVTVLIGGVLGSIANTEAAHDSVADQSLGFMLTVTIANGIVQLLQNTRSVMLLMSQDRSHLKRHRLNAVNHLLPEARQKSPAEIYNRSFGSAKHTSMAAQVLMLGAGLLFAGLYNYTAAIRPIEVDNPSWSPWVRHGAAAINFCVKSILLTRATSAQSRRIMQAKAPSAVKAVGFGLVGILGVLSVSGAAEYPKRYLFNDDNNLLSSIISIVIAVGACMALNAGDMLDAARIIYSFIVNKVIKEKMCGHKPTPEQRFGENYEALVNKAMLKVQGEDENDHFHHQGYAPEHECEGAVTVSEQPRSIWLTAADLQPAYQSAGDDYLPMHNGVKYHPKEKGETLLRSSRQLSDLHHKMYADQLAALGCQAVAGAEDRARQYADDGMETLYQMHLQQLSQPAPAAFGAR